MFPSFAFTPDWIDSQRKQLGGCDPGILEKCVHALTLLGYLAESGLPFIFKGGTSILLHLPQIRRLSRDIDILCGQTPAEVDGVVREIGARAPFLRSEEDARGARGLPRRRHFKFFYRSALPGKFEQEILLDVVEEGREVHSLVTLPIQTSFLKAEVERLVRVPTIESLLGDKLTAFAPHTTGVPFYSKTTEDQSQQVAKQFFDIGVLFEFATDFVEIAKTYDAIRAQESEYRENRHTREATLDDTFQACLALTATKKLELYPEASLLHDGFDKMKGHLTWPQFIQGREPRRTLAARAGVLVAHLRAGVPFDLVSARYAGTTEQLAVLKTATLDGTPHPWINGVRATNPEAFYYWHKAIKLSGSK